MDSGVGSNINAQITETPIANGWQQDILNKSEQGLAIQSNWRVWYVPMSNGFLLSFLAVPNQGNKCFFHCPQALNLRVTLLVVARSNEW